MYLVMAKTSQRITHIFPGPTTERVCINQQQRAEPMHHDMSLVTRKPVFGVFDQVILKPACAAT